LASPVPLMPPGSNPSDATSVKIEREVLARYRAEAPRLATLTGRGVQAWLQEQWAELHAWCVHLATTLDGTTTRIEAASAERKAVEQRVSELEENKGWLEHLCSQRNVAELEAKAAVVQDLINSFAAIKEELAACRQDVEARDATIAQQQGVIDARDKTVAALEKQLADARAESERLVSALAVERVERVTAEEGAQRANEEIEAARAETARVRREASVGAAHAEIDLAKLEEELGQMSRRNEKRLAEAQAARETTLAELASAEEQLKVESTARIDALGREADIRERLDVAMRALRQSEEGRAR